MRWKRPQLRFSTFLAPTSTPGRFTCNLLLNLAEGDIEMLGQPANQILARSLQAGLLGWALSQAPLAPAAAAESLPASVRACTAETDRERRLDCFDREVARFPDAKATSQAARKQPAAPPGTPTGSAVAAASPNTPTGSAAAAASTAPAMSAAPAASTATASPSAAKAPAANAASANASPGTADAAPARKSDNTTKPGRITARLVSIDRAPNEMALHLDNGQVWEEVQSVAGDLSLKAGDNVTIDKRLGSYWLTGPHVSGMKVRQRN